MSNASRNYVSLYVRECVFYGSYYCYTIYIIIFDLSTASIELNYTLFHQQYQILPTFVAARARGHHHDTNSIE